MGREYRLGACPLSLWPSWGSSTGFPRVLHSSTEHSLKTTGLLAFDLRYSPRGGGKHHLKASPCFVWAELRWWATAGARGCQWCFHWVLLSSPASFVGFLLGWTVLLKKTNSHFVVSQNHSLLLWTVMWGGAEWKSHQKVNCSEKWLLFFFLKNYSCGRAGMFL